MKITVQMLKDFERADLHAIAGRYEVVKASEVDGRQVHGGPLAAEVLLPRSRRGSGEVPAIPTDKARLHVALWKLANALGVTLDASRSDHELVEQVADACSAKLGQAFREGAADVFKDADERPGTPRTNPYDGTRYFIARPVKF